MLKAVGYSDDDLAKPLIGVANTWTEIGPCNFHLRKLAVDVKRGIRAAGGTPFRVQHHQHLGRHHHGHRGHERLADQPRDHRR